MLQRASHIFRVRRPWSPSLPCQAYAHARPLAHSGCCYILRTYSTATAREEKKASDPLRILFCGSDDFSGASLKALYEEHRTNPGLVESIDVVVRPGKPTGRGYKVIREVPIKALATSLGLPVHERDTFTGWEMPSATNLIIAVSFGLFVPPRLLGAAKYGGLNVHPSLLPAYRGPAPLHHILLDGVQTTGVTLQTLDETSFDRGVILARNTVKWKGGGGAADDSSSGAMTSRIPRDCTVAQLQEAAAAVGAQLLVESLRRGLHVPPRKDVVYTDPSVDPATYHAPWAPKITSWDRQVPPWTWFRPRSLARRQRVVGPLWFKARAVAGGGGSTKELKRILVEETDEVDCGGGKRKSKDRDEYEGERRNSVGARSIRKVFFPPKTAGKWSYRKLHRWYQEPPPPPPPPKGSEGEEKGGKGKEEPVRTFSRPIYYWTHPSDDAIYISPYNPPSVQTEAYVRIPLLKVEGEKAKAAAQVAEPFSAVAPLPRLTWERRRRLKRTVDYDLHVACEVEGLRYATGMVRLPDSLDDGGGGKLGEACDRLEKVLDEYNPILETINMHWISKGHQREKARSLLDSAAEPHIATEWR